MNCSVYIFGELSSGYTQYPEDSSSHILNRLITNCKATTQLVIRRDDNLMYYSYVRKLENNKYVGIAIAVNGYYIQHIQSLFALFENTIEKLVLQGSIICFSKDGNIIPTQKQLKEQEEDIDSITQNLAKDFNNAGQACKLPPVDYTVAKESVKEFNISDSKRDIVRSSYTYGYTYIYKDNDYNTVKVDSYRSVLSRVNLENVDLKKRNSELHEENQKILRQSKQFKNVILLILLVIGCGVGIYFLYNTLNDTQYQLDEANETIVKKDNTIERKNNKIVSLGNSIDSLKNVVKNEKSKREKAEEILTEICTYNPFIVTKCEVSSSDFSFDYYAPEEKEVSVTLKAVNEKNSEIVSNTHTLTFYKGSGSKKISFRYKLDTSDYYYVVLIYDGKIIAGKRW